MSSTMTSGSGIGIPVALASGIRQRKTRWLWTGRLSCGSVALLAGRSSSGKSTLAAGIAAQLTGGPRLAGHEGPVVRGAVLWLSAEESLATIVKPRLRAAGANLRKVAFPGSDEYGVTQHAVEFPADLPALRTLILDMNAALVIVDPLASYTPSIDLNAQQAVRQLMGGLQTVSQQTGVTWLVVAHPNKSRTGNVLDRIFGSGAIRDFARSILLVGEHPECDGSRVVVNAKQSEGAEAPSLRFRFAFKDDKPLPPRVDWQGETPVTKEMLGVDAMDAGEQDGYLDARELLRTILTDWRPAKEVLAEGQAAGISERTMRAAKAELRCASRRVNDGMRPPHSEWGPPDTKPKR